ncbi:hypothetical protein KDX05_07270 [Burkholderia vietnamiensis]|uniref:hypothetical protein n=1 Tax=Burkholderia vietnamiensis TaxID=60552 RepID=UPI001B8E8B17|nr:hypothetical protein [Burkholderia vietnamiensis]MBR8228111.1 hypothetical protein [Burkholderia vietnamiensis]
MSLEAGVFPVGRPNVSASGTLVALNDAISLNCDGIGSVDFALAGTNANAVVTFEFTDDGTTWIATKAKPGGVGGALTSTATGAGSYNVNCGGRRAVRARLSTIGSGSFTAVAVGTVAVRHVQAVNDTASDLNAAVVDGNLTPVGYQQITNLTTATSLMVPTGARIAAIQAEAGTLRYRDDGVAPTATVGMVVGASGSVNYTGSLAAVQLIAATAGAIANVSYYK